MLLELTPGWIITLNIGTVLAVHMGVSWCFTRMPARWFRPEAFLFRELLFERQGFIYQRIFHVRQWKGILPDAAPWFDGFAKKNLRSKDHEFLKRFVVETCRGEAAHLAQVAGLWIPLLWNPGVAALVMLAYSFLSNLPCLIVQRHTRARLRNVLRNG